MLVWCLAGVGVQSLTLVISQEGGISTPEVAAAAAAAKSGAAKGSTGTKSTTSSSKAGSPAASAREAAGGPSSPIGGIVGGIIGGVAAAFLLLLGASLLDLPKQYSVFVDTTCICPQLPRQ